ncbi:MAG: TlyA family RNA methyltransferase [Anaerolineae bacterium]
MGSRRLDVEMVARGLAQSRHRAQQLIDAGAVTVDGRPAAKASMAVHAGATIGVADAIPYVGRGGLKLAAALAAFAVAVPGRTALDVGASTGGFTDVLLRQGAARVFAVDVGHGQLAPSLRSDPRVTSLEGTDIRELAPLPGPVDIAVIDVSFISLRLVLPAVARHLAPAADVVALLKPQFEAGPGAVNRQGVLRDPERRLALVSEFCDWAVQQGWLPLAAITSPVAGGEGNVEYLLHLVRAGEGDTCRPDVAPIVAGLRGPDPRTEGP